MKLPFFNGEARLETWVQHFRKREDQVTVVLSFVIGALVGLVVVAFILLTGRLATRMYPPGSAAWRRVFIPTLGALVSGYLLYRYFPNARGSGIPQTKFALFVNDGYIRLRTVFGKFICCCISLASGIALGREGPSVQIGAGIASVLGRRFGLRTDNVKALLPIGCSAALAAAFNTPIAAVLFSLEEILGDMQAPVLGSVVISSATSWMVLHLILGDEPLFHVPAYQLVNPGEFLIYAALGLIGGLGSVCFVKLLLSLRIRFRRLPPSSLWIQPAIGGLVVGLLGWWKPEVLGVGYDYVERVLDGDLAMKAIAILAVLKIVATATAYASGNAGGIFGPSLFIGAMIGGTVGSLAHRFAPGVTAGPGAYALVGMGAAFAGIVRTPITSVIMIFEMTRDYNIIVPLMISNLISFYISYKLQREPIYEALAHQEGVHLPGGENREHLSRLQVGRVVRQGDEAFPPNMSVKTAAELMQSRKHSAWPVAGDGKLLGVLKAVNLTADKIATEDPIGRLFNGAPLYTYVYPDDPLSIALERMGAAGVDTLPVVSRADITKLLGVVTLAEVLQAYGLNV
jgi:CIC family chloride channel protein